MKSPDKFKKFSTFRFINVLTVYHIFVSVLISQKSNLFLLNDRKSTIIFTLNFTIKTSDFFTIAHQIYWQKAPNET